jgi:hypothetical protein
MTEVQIPSEVTTLIQSAPAYLERTREIVSADDYLVANDELAAIKTTEKQLKEKYDYLLEPSKKAYNETKARLDETFKPGFEGLAAAKKAWDAAIVGYRREQQRLADEENRRRQEQVAKEQRRLREEAAAEQAKAEKRATELRAKAAEAEAAGKAAQAARAREQAEARERDAASRVSVLEQTAATMAATTVEANVPKSDSGHGRKTYSGRLALDAELTAAEQQYVAVLGNPIIGGGAFEVLVVAIAQGITSGTGYPSISLLKLDQTALNKQASALKDHFRIPGCRLEVKETTVSARSK